MTLSMTHTKAQLEQTEKKT